MSAPRIPSPLVALRREVEIWAGLLFFGAGIAMLVLATNLALTELRYAREAITVPATVLQRDFIPADRNDNPATRYRLHYRYALAGDAPRQRSEDVDVDRWEALAPGAQFDLAVLPGEGARPRGGGLAEKIGIAVLVILGALFLPLGWMLGGSRLRRAIGRIWVSRRGVETTGAILEVVGTGTAINRVQMLRMRFRFTDLKGVSHEGETGLLSPAEAEGLEPGAAGWVRYDMANPAVSVWMDRGTQGR